MLASLLIVFREVLEIALVVMCIMAATKGITNRSKFILGGMGAGLIGAGLIAAFTSTIAGAMAGTGQEIMNAGILFTAVIMLTWHVVWMSSHGKALATKIKEVGESIVSGKTPLYVLGTMAGLAVLREGSEIVLFMHGLAAGGLAMSSLMLGAVVGLLIGAAFGIALYKGLVLIPTRYLFSVTNVMIVAIAAGMAAKGASFLIQADILPALKTQMWDSSHILSESTLLGETLSAIAGYTARPSGMELLIYLVTICGIAALSSFYRGLYVRRSEISRRGAAATVAVLLAMLIVPAQAQAAFKVYSPIVEKGELEFEFQGEAAFDNDGALDGEREYVMAVGYGVLDWWKTEVALEWAKDPNGGTDFDAVEFENIFQLTPQGKYSLDWGLFTEIKLADKSTAADKFEFGPLVQKQYGKTIHTANLIFEEEFGANASSTTKLEYAWQTRYLYEPYFEPGFEIYGSLGEIRNFNSPEDQKHKAGPVIFGEFSTGKGKIGYEIGYLFGLTDAEQDGSIKWLVEYEIPF